MNRTFKLYLIIFGIVLVIIAVLELNKTTVLNWSKTYSIGSKHPFGLHIFNAEADKLFGGKLQRIEASAYDHFSADSTALSQNLLFINRWESDEGIEKILQRVEKGDYAFFISEDIPYFLADSMEFSVLKDRWETDNTLRLKESRYSGVSVYIDKIAGGYSVPKIDTVTTRILGSSLDKSDKETANFIEVKYGKGKFLIHTEPMVLTNFYLLNDDDYRYVEGMFSYLPDRKTIWFTDSEEYVNESPLRFILSQPALRYAWYIFLLALPLFVLFHAKRRQRIVPVIEPLKNSSAEFVKTIGNLYLQEGDSKDMARKKATYFLNKIRTELMVDSHELNEEFVRRLRLKTGAKEEIIKEAIPLIHKAVHDQAPVQKEELVRLNQLLDEIYK